MQEKTEWHNISMFGRLAEVGNEYLKKGSQVFIEGRIQTNKSEKDGQTRYFTSIIANQMQMLGSKDNSVGSSAGGSNEKSNPSSEKASPAPAASNFDEFEDDIPF
jgi:single-strand DNA-binding protein